MNKQIVANAKVQALLGKTNIQTFQIPVVLANDTNPPIVYGPLTWKPDFWVVVGRLTAGFINIYPAQSKSPQVFRINTGTIRIPLHTDTLSVETVGATGFYSLYAVKGLDSFEVQA